MRIDMRPMLLLLVLLQGCVTVDPEQARSVEASKVNVQLGIGYLRQNKLELASEKLEKALLQDPKSASAHNAYAILQDRLQQYDKAENHYKQATRLDPRNSEAANNYGAFLCRNGREVESEKYFLQAIENPLYKTPEYAYTNAAICLLKVDRVEPAREYLRKALASKSDFASALIAMADIYFKDGNYDAAKLYIDRFHLVAKPSAKSLWLGIRAALETDSSSNVDELTQRLETEFPDSPEYEAWKKIR